MLNFKIKLCILCQENIVQGLHKVESISITSQLKEIARDTKSDQIRSRLSIFLDSDDPKAACAYDMLYHLPCLVTQLRDARKPSSENKSPWRSGLGRRRYFDKSVSQHLSGAGSSPDDSVGRDLNLQKLRYKYLTTSMAVVLVVR